jgi:hypothetical protein
VCLATVGYFVIPLAIIRIEITAAAFDVIETLPVGSAMYEAA